MRLRDWIAAQELSFAELGRSIGVTTSEARRFALGERTPRQPTMHRIYLATAGQVTPNDFYNLPPLPDTTETGGDTQSRAA
jgi:transcriptional regulator with XRE-family HTH domain